MTRAHIIPGLTGHAVHSSESLLLDPISSGRDFVQTRMLAFGSQLSDGGILSILAYIKIWWGPDELTFQGEISLNGRYIAVSSSTFLGTGMWAGVYCRT